MRRLGYMPALDGVRAVAILLVVGHHYFLTPPGGSIGVDLFFVLSGFLITTLLLDERAETGRVSLRAFYVRRARRLFPALAVCVVVYVLLAAVRGENGWPEAGIGISYGANIVDALGVKTLILSPLSSLWSLAQEEQFYLLWPITLLVLLRSVRPAQWVALFLAAFALERVGLSLTQSSGPRIYYGPDTNAVGLLAGCLLAMLRHRGTEAGEVAAKFGVAIMFLAAIIAWHVPSWDLIGWPVSQFGMVLLVAAATGATALASGLSTRPLVWLGRRSYSLYLWHMPALWLTAAALGHWGSRVAAVPLALCFAAASYRYVEQPFRRRRVAPVIERVEPVIDPVAGSAA